MDGFIQILNFYLLGEHDMGRPKITAYVGNTCKTVELGRPRWEDVYAGYLLERNETGKEKDISADTVFKTVLGENYDKAVFKNACATRVSFALIKAKMELRKDFIVQVGCDAGKGFIASVKKLQEWLTTVWGIADKVIENKSSLKDVAEIINGRNGVYIILNGNAKKDHATLWIGADNNAVGGNHYIGEGCIVYFWELKGSSSANVVNNTLRCTYEDGKPDDFNCGVEGKSQIHDKLTCKHYSKIRKLLEENLSENELYVFNSLESSMKIGTVEYMREGISKFTFSEEKKCVLTNIKADANGEDTDDRLNQRIRYQRTIHELWHSIDFLACEQFGNMWQNGSLYMNLVRNGVKVNFISCLYRDNLLGRTITKDIEKFGRTAICERLNTIYRDEYKPFYVNQHRENNQDDVIKRISGFRYLSDIIVGEHTRHIARFKTKIFFNPRESDQYWRSEKGVVLLSTECFAAIGCMKAANPEYFSMITEHLPESCRVYSEIITFIKEQLEKN